MRKPIIPAVCLLSGLLLAACADPGDAAQRTTEQLQENKSEMSEARTEGAEEWRKERDEAAKELRDLREDLVRKQQKERERLADGIKDATKRAECEARIAELTSSIARVDAALVKVDGGADTNWQEIKRDARKTVDDTKNWIQREAEKIDWETGADADDDGH